MGGDQPQKGGKGGVKVCIDKSKTKKVKQKKFNTKYKVDKLPSSRPTPTETGGRGQNVRDLENNPWDIKLQKASSKESLSDDQMAQGRKLEDERAKLKKKMARAEQFNNLKVKLKLTKKAA